MVTCDISNDGPVLEEDFDDEDDDNYDPFLCPGDEERVQLGTVVPLEGSMANKVLFKNVDWHEWDGGKAGGWPVWLNPRDLPAQEIMRCGECKGPLSFLVQLYCPLDHEDDAFHRCLYVFCCPKASCSNNSSVKALRCQLPRENPFYPYEPDDRVGVLEVQRENTQQMGSNPEAWGMKLCCVCGQLSKSVCSKCRIARYCGREHQVQHWKVGGHKKDCRGDADREPASPGAAKDILAAAAHKHAAAGSPREGTVVSPSVFRELEVEVRPEPPPPPPAADGRTAEDALMSKMGLQDGEDCAAAVDQEDEDSRLSQAELDRVAGVHGVKDKVTLQFLARTQPNPQVVRYDTVGAGPLWSSSKSIPSDADVPACERCGQRRKFEFQVMPQLLHHLGVDANAKAVDAKAASVSASIGESQGSATTRPPVVGECMDWGTLAVYTCPDSCPSNPPKSPERQPQADRMAGRGGSGEGVRVGDDEMPPAPPVGPAAVVGYVEEFVWRQPPP